MNGRWLYRAMWVPGLFLLFLLFLPWAFTEDGQHYADETSVPHGAYSGLQVAVIVLLALCG